MLNNNLDLMILNSEKIEKVDGTFGMGIFKRCNALIMTIKNVEIDVLKVNEARGISSINLFIIC